MRRVAAGRYLASVLVVLAVSGHGRSWDGPGPGDDSLAKMKGDNEKAMEALLRREALSFTAKAREASQKATWSQIRDSARRAFAWAEAHPDDPESIDAIVWTVHGLANGYYPEYADEIRKAYTLLTDRAIANEKVAPVCYYAEGVSIHCAEARRFLETALATSPSRLVRAVACLGLARHEALLGHLAARLRDPITARPFEERWKGIDRFLEEVAKVDSDAAERAAGRYYDRVAAEFGDVKMPAPYNQTPFAELARGELYAMRNLSVGKVAPDIVGEDMEGRPLRLSDFRGKVVTINFWATWCGPCMGMVPDERKLMKRLEGKPFTILGINGDDDRSKARETMAKESMTWPSFWNNGKTGGIVADWGVRSWPTIYVLDAKGVIRYEAVRGEMLDRAVEKLIAELEKPAG